MLDQEIPVIEVFPDIRVRIDRAAAIINSYYVDPDAEVGIINPVQDIGDKFRDGIAESIRR